MIGLWWAAAASAATCGSGVATYDAGIVLLELRWEKPGEKIALRCRDPKKPGIVPPEMTVDAKIVDGWVEGDTLQATSDKQKKAQYTGEIDQYLGKELKLPSNELFTTANLLAFDCLNVWAQWAPIVAPSCGTDGLKDATVTEGDEGKVVQKVEAFASEVMGRGSEAQERMTSTWTLGDDGWAKSLRLVQERDGKVIDDQTMQRVPPLPAEKTAPTPEPGAPEPAADGG